MKKLGKVYICHHVDTEGPLFESLEATFDRIRFITGLKLEPIRINLEKLRSNWFGLSDKEMLELGPLIDEHSLNFLENWDDINEMLDVAMSNEFRNKVIDSSGNGWLYNWHIMDHVGFTGDNPRRRDLGYHKIFDFYTDKISAKNSNRDAIHWHFHPISFSKDAHIPATSYDNSMYELHQVITRRVIDKNWFPVVNRAGFHTVRFDSNLFLESWIPFDPSNQSVEESMQPQLQQDISFGRYGDWRGAPNDWSIYRPSFYDWRKNGQMQRSIARVLNMSARHRSIYTEEIEKAFRKANMGENVYLGITNHDWRDMRKEIDYFLQLLMNVKRGFPGVDFYFSESVSAFNSVIYQDGDQKNEKLNLDIELIDNKLIVRVVSGEIFGPQPYLAIKTKYGDYYHDNFDFLNEGNVEFSYVFDEYTIPLDCLSIIGVASNDKYGNQCLKCLNFD